MAADNIARAMAKKAAQNFSDRLTRDGMVRGEAKPPKYADGAYARFVNPLNWDFSNFNPLTYGNAQHNQKISENLTNGWTATGATVTADAGIAPNGETTASKLTYTDNTQYVQLNTNKLSKSDGTAFPGSAVTGKTYTFSAWVWSSNKTQICLRIAGVTTGTDSDKNIVTLTATPTRVSVTRTFTSTDTNFTIAFDNRSALGFGDGGAGDLFVWGARIDEGATPKRYYSPCEGYLAFVGDSLTYGAGTSPGTNAYPKRIMDGYNGFFHVQDTYNYGVAGYKTRDILNDWATVNVATTAQNKYLAVWIGTNDIMSGLDVTLTHASLAAYCRKARAAGWKVFVLTAIARGDVPQTNSTRLIYNDLIRNNYPSYADFLVDVAADQRFATPVTAATDVYSADLTHLTPYGYQQIAGMVKTVMDREIMFSY
jgi:lysophospholipase L1-like esterase